MEPRAEKGKEFRRARHRLERGLPFLGVAVFVAALRALDHQLGDGSWSEVRGAIGEIPLGALLGALVLTAASFLVLSGHDGLALRYARHPLEGLRSRVAACLGHAFSRPLGFPLFTSAPVRHRLYSAWGLTNDQFLRVMLFGRATLWLGFLALGGVLFLFAPPVQPEDGILPMWGFRSIGAVLLLVLAGYLAWAPKRDREVRVARIRLSAPGGGLAVGQVLLGVGDWLVAAAALWILLPPGHGMDLVHFAGAFVAARIAGQLSRVPGGLGVVEAILLLLPEGVDGARMFASFLVWRGVYYFLPLFLAVGFLGAWELRAKGSAMGRSAGMVGRAVLLASPLLLAGGTFVSGALLVLYGSIPPAPGHLAWVDRFVPHRAFELSHFLTSLAGAALLVLAWGLVQRLDTAYRMTLGLLGVGILLSLVRGFEMIPAAAMALLLVALLPARGEFFRKASVTAEPLSPGWIALILGALAAGAWMISLSYRDPGVGSELWWSFTLGGEASRSVRALTGASCLLALFGALRILRPAVPPEFIRPAREIPAAVEVAAHASPRAVSLLALTGDKCFLLSESGNGFIMYAVEGRAWVSLGDPVASPGEAAVLIRRFRELAHRYRGWPVFYQVRPDRLPHYLDAGLSLLKLGEEARIPLETFTLGGSRGREFRQTLNRAEREGLTFACLRGDEVDHALPELRSVSDEWLGSRQAREKGFSVGSFHPPYLRRTPVGVARQGERIVGFVNLLMPDARDEMSADLMRYRADAMKGVMDYLFTRAILLGQEEGYRAFSLGMAPLSGLETGPLAPLAARLGTAVFRHGEHFYNFQGLRAYKEKFGPEWEPRYLASPGGLALPRVLASAGALIGGGVIGMVRR